jgi:hypothetical protein
VFIERIGRALDRFLLICTEIEYSDPSSITSRSLTVCRRNNWLKLLSVVRKKYDELSSVVKREADLKIGDDVWSCTFVRRTIDIHKVGNEICCEIKFFFKPTKKA